MKRALVVVIFALAWVAMAALAVFAIWKGWIG